MLGNKHSRQVRNSRSGSRLEQRLKHDGFTDDLCEDLAAEGCSSILTIDSLVDPRLESGLSNTIVHFLIVMS